MLAEFVKSIGDLARSGDRPKLVTDPRDPRVLYQQLNGRLEPLPAAVPMMRSTVETISDLFAAIERFGSQRASVWHNRQEIAALLSDDERYECVTLFLRRSAQLISLQDLPRTFDQRTLLLFLKRSLAGSLPEGVLPLFRSLDFRRATGSESSLEHGGESLGRSVHAEVEGRADIPEFLSPVVPVYCNEGLMIPAEVRLSVDIDVHNATIVLTPLPDEVERAELHAQREVGGMLRAAAEDLDGDRSVAVLYGNVQFRSEKL